VQILGLAHALLSSRAPSQGRPPQWFGCEMFRILMQSPLQPIGEAHSVQSLNSQSAGTVPLGHSFCTTSQSSWRGHLCVCVCWPEQTL